MPLPAYGVAGVGQRIHTRGRARTRAFGFSMTAFYDYGKD